MYAPPDTDLNNTEIKQPTFVSGEQLPRLSPDEEEKFYKKVLLVPLTDKELLDLGSKAANLSEEIRLTEMEFKDLSKDWKDRISGMWTTLSGLLKVVKDAKEERLVECREVRNYNEFTVSFYFGEHLCEKRAMTAEERQPTLPGTELKDLDHVEIQERPTEEELVEAGAQVPEGPEPVEVWKEDKAVDEYEGEEKNIINISELKAND